METKICCKCKKMLSNENFKSNKNKKDGLQGQCIECQKKYRREHYLNNKEKYIKKAAVQTLKIKKWYQDLKSTFKCSEENCLESHPACIQFHHINADKEAGIASMINSCSKQAVLDEIKKCIPLCANCHFKLHWNERNNMNKN